MRLEKAPGCVDVARCYDEVRGVENIVRAPAIDGCNRREFKKQMDDMRQRQMQGAWYQQQQQAGAYPVKERGGCAKAFSFVLTLLVGSVVLGVFCGGGAYFAAGFATNDSDVAIFGAIGGGILALILALILAIRAAR